eukprot:365965-Chlamydomonas_euryale.AAC.18
MQVRSPGSRRARTQRGGTAPPWGCACAMPACMRAGKACVGAAGSSELAAVVNWVEEGCTRRSWRGPSVTLPACALRDAPAAPAHFCRPLLKRAREASQFARCRSSRRNFHPYGLGSGGLTRLSDPLAQSLPRRAVAQPAPRPGHHAGHQRAARARVQPALRPDEARGGGAAAAREGAAAGGAAAAARAGARGRNHAAEARGAGGCSPGAHACMFECATAPLHPLCQYQLRAVLDVFALAGLCMGGGPGVGFVRAGWAVHGWRSLCWIRSRWLGCAWVAVYEASCCVLIAASCVLHAGSTHAASRVLHAVPCAAYVCPRAAFCGLKDACSRLSAYCMLHAASRLLCAACCKLCAAARLLHVVRCMEHAAWYVLHPACRMMLAACRMMHAARCILRAA